MAIRVPKDGDSFSFEESLPTGKREQHFEKLMSPCRENVFLESRGDFLVVHLSGKIFEEALLQSIVALLKAVVGAYGQANIVINCTELEYLSAGATRQFLEFDSNLKTLSQGPRRLHFSSLEGLPQQLFQLQRLHRVFGVSPEVTTAIGKITREVQARVDAAKK